MKEKNKKEKVLELVTELKNNIHLQIKEGYKFNDKVEVTQEGCLDTNVFFLQEIKEKNSNNNMLVSMDGNDIEYYHLYFESKEYLIGVDYYKVNKKYELGISIQEAKKEKKPNSTFYSLTKYKLKHKLFEKYKKITLEEEEKLISMLQIASYAAKSIGENNIIEKSKTKKMLT